MMTEIWLGVGLAAAGAALVVSGLAWRAERQRRIRAERALSRVAQPASPDPQQTSDAAARQHAEAEYEQLIRDLDAFAHTVAHGLKNPLSTILGYASMVADGMRESGTPAEDPVLSALNAIERSSLHMREIISSLLFFARVRSAGEVPCQPVIIAYTVHNALERLEFMIEDSHAQILTPDPATNPESWPVACGYRAWIEEVWANYISNALKYGGSPPRIELGWDTRPDGMLRFWVRDYGPGIPPELQPRLFQQFERLGTDHPEGHGRGLSIAQRIVTKLGGEVGVESTVGQGSLFYFTLPPDPEAPTSGASTEGAQALSAATPGQNTHGTSSSA